MTIYLDTSVIYFDNFPTRNLTSSANSSISDFISICK